MGEYIANKERLWAELQVRDNTTNLSDDLLAFFLLEGALLSQEEQRAIILATLHVSAGCLEASRS